MPVHKDHVVQFVDRFEAQDERRVAVLLERRCREQRGFQAMRTAFADDTAEGAQRGGAAGLLVVRKIVQITLYGDRGRKPCDEPPLTARKTARITTSRQGSSRPRAPDPATSHCPCRPSRPCRRRR